jgi:hypothetical protein
MLTARERSVESRCSPGRDSSRGRALAFLFARDQHPLARQFDTGPGHSAHRDVAKLTGPAARRYSRIATAQAAMRARESNPPRRESSRIAAIRSAPAGPPDALPSVVSVDASRQSPNGCVPGWSRTGECTELLHHGERVEDSPMLVREAIVAEPDDVDQLDVDALEGCGYTHEPALLQMLVLDQTRPEVDLSVVKVVVPGLRQFWPRFAPGRLYDVPVARGRLPGPLSEAELNPVPICT